MGDAHVENSVVAGDIDGVPSVCCVAPYVPHAGVDHAGGDYLNQYLLGVLELGWNVVLVAPDSAGNRTAASKAPDGLRVILGPEEASSSRFRRIANTLRSGFPGPSPEQWWRRLSPEARTALREATVVDLQFGQTIRFAKVIRRELPTAVIAATSHDLLSQSAERARKSPAFPERVRSRVQLPHYRHMERTCLNLCDSVLVFNPTNVAVLRRELGVRTPIRTAMPVVHVDTNYPSPSPDSKRLLFVAAFWRSENAEAASWFLDHVWPIVHRHDPDVKVRFAGSRPPQWLISRASQWIEVTGYLAHLSSAYRDIAVVIAPIRRGAGIKFKVVQALALGFPVVCTTVASEGVNELLKTDLIDSFDTAEDFALGIIRTLDDIASETDRSVASSSQVRACLDFGAYVRDSLNHYSTLVEVLRDHR